MPVILFPDAFIAVVQDERERVMGLSKKRKEKETIFLNFNSLIKSRVFISIRVQQKNKTAARLFCFGYVSGGGIYTKGGATGCGD